MIHWKGQQLSIGDVELAVDFPIQDARRIGNLVLVLFRPESQQTASQFNNLIAFSLAGEKKWVAELPTTSSMDAYYQILDCPDLVATTYTSFRCRLDPDNGRILSREFFK